MNKKNRWMLIAGMILISALCIIFAPKMGSEVSSVVGGVLSVIATTILGLIAVWQNENYKKLSDEKDKQTERLLLTPECRLFSVKDNRPVNMSCQIAVPDCEDGERFYMLFTALNLPMIDITVEKIEIQDEANKEHSLILPNSMLLFNYAHFSVLQNYSNFVIEIMVPQEFIGNIAKYSVTLSYKNIYDNMIEKKFSMLYSPGKRECKIKSQERAIIKEDNPNG